MIGDKVYCHHPSRPKEIVTVDADLLKLMERIESGIVTSESPLYRIIEPIPLTPEILEKNGFDKKESYLVTGPYIRYELSCSNYRIVVTPKPNKIWSLECLTAKTIPQVRLYIKCVNELQHALRQRIRPKFSVGDIVCRKGYADHTVVEIYLCEDPVYLCKNDEGLESDIPFSEQDKWEQKEQKPIEVHIDNPNIQKFDPDVKVTTSDSSASGKELLYVSSKSYGIGFRDGVASVKPAEWSEEDELMRSACIAFIKDEKFKGYERSYECIDWLKSLRPVKQEWNTHDKAIVNCIICCLNGQFVSEAARRQCLEWFNKHRRDFLNSASEKPNTPGDHFRDDTKMIEGLDEAAEISDEMAKEAVDEYINFLAKGLSEHASMPIGPKWMKEFAAQRFKAGASWAFGQGVKMVGFVANAVECYGG